MGTRRLLRRSGLLKMERSRPPAGGSTVGVDVVAPAADEAPPPTVRGGRDRR